MHLLEDRGQIAEQLRDRAMSRLYATGAAMQGILPKITNASAREVLGRQIDEVDAVDAIIGDIRRDRFRASRFRVMNSRPPSCPQWIGERWVRDGPEVTAAG